MFSLVIERDLCSMIVPAEYCSNIDKRNESSYSFLGHFSHIRIRAVVRNFSLRLAFIVATSAFILATARHIISFNKKKAPRFPSVLLFFATCPFLAVICQILRLILFSPSSAQRLIVPMNLNSTMVPVLWLTFRGMTKKASHPPEHCFYHN